MFKKKAAQKKHAQDAIASQKTAAQRHADRKVLKRLLLANFSLDRDRVRAHQRFNGHDPRLYSDLCHDPMLKELGLRYENIG